MCVYGGGGGELPAQGTAWALGPSPESLKERAGIRSTEVFGNSGGSDLEARKRRVRRASRPGLYLAYSRLSRPVM